LRTLICFWLLVWTATLRAQVREPNGAGVQQGTLPSRWNPAGPKCMEVADWQVHEYNPDFYIVRQSGCLDYEKPFLYLIFGKERGLLLDTGSRNFPAAEMVTNVLGKYLQRTGRKQIQLVVVHSHSHSDHVAGDAQVEALRNPAIAITFVPAEVEATKRFYGIRNWPEETGSVDLGGRVIDAIPIPGHDIVSVALYDRLTGVLLTGDSLYPGRLYVKDFDAFVKSTDRLVEFTKGKVVTHIMGCHIEQTTTAYLDYPIGTIYQPHEHVLELSRGHLLELQAALHVLNGVAAEMALSDFTIWPVPPDSHMRRSTQAVFDAVQKKQLADRWNQPH
jgi:hydroxyacylglutathione hydrolase